MSYTSSSRGFDPAFAKSLTDKILREVSKVVVGKIDVIKYVLMGLYTGGHVLLEGVPGVAKTYFAIGARFHLGLLRASAAHLGSDSHWQKLAIAALIEAAKEQLRK